MTEQTVTQPETPQPEPEHAERADHTNPDPQPADSVADDLRAGREKYEELARDAEGNAEYLRAQAAQAQAQAEWNRRKAEALGQMMDDMGIPRVSAGTAHMKIPDEAIL